MVLESEILESENVDEAIQNMLSDKLKIEKKAFSKELKLKNVAFFGFKLAWRDGSAHQVDEWARIFLKQGANVHMVAGDFWIKTDKLKKAGEVPEVKEEIVGEEAQKQLIERRFVKFKLIKLMSFKDSRIRAIKKMAFNTELDEKSKKSLHKLIYSTSNVIRDKIRSYIIENKIELIVVDKIFSDPLNIPLSIALKKVIKELNIPCIARHSDVYLERHYFTKNKNIPDIMNEVFPPNLRNMVHVASTIKVKEELESKNIKAIIIPPVLPSNVVNGGAVNHISEEELRERIRSFFGIKGYLLLQPTKLTKRKNIEYSIMLVHELDKLTGEKNTLMITGPPIYERGKYFASVLELAKKYDINLIVNYKNVIFKPFSYGDVKVVMDDQEFNKKQVYATFSKGKFSLKEIYATADFVVVPSLQENFNTIFLEAVYLKKPFLGSEDMVPPEFKKKKIFFIKKEISDNDYKIKSKEIFDLLKRRDEIEEELDKNREIINDFYSKVNLERILNVVSQAIVYKTSDKRTIMDNLKKTPKNLANFSRMRFVMDLMHKVEK